MTQSPSLAADHDPPSPNDVLGQRLDNALRKPLRHYKPALVRIVYEQMITEQNEKIGSVLDR